MFFFCNIFPTHLIKNTIVIGSNHFSGTLTQRHDIMLRWQALVLGSCLALGKMKYLICMYIKSQRAALSFAVHYAKTQN